MKILFFVMSEAIGGLEIITELYFKELIKRNIDVLFMLKKGSHLHYRLASYGNRIIPTTFSESKFSPPLVKELRKVVKKNKIEILHVHTRIDIWTASLAVRGLSTNLVYTSYNYIENTYKRDPIHKLIYGRCDLITVFSESQQKGFIKCLPVIENNVKIIPHGIDIQKYNIELIDAGLSRKALGLSSNDLVVGVVGRIMENKGQWMVVRIAKKLIEEFSNLKILFVGADSKGRVDEYYSRLLAEVKELNLEDRVFFTGFRTDIPECLSAIDIFVLSSQTENFGTVLLEAMAMERPCLGTNSGGTPEILDWGKAGILFEYGNLEELYCKLHLFLSNPNMQKEYRKKARLRVEENYTLDKTINIWTNTYRNLLDLAHT